MNRLKLKKVVVDSIAHSLMRNLGLGITMCQQNVRAVVVDGSQRKERTMSSKMREAVEEISK